MNHRALLVFPPYKAILSEAPPIGISYLASYVLENVPQLDVKLIDFTLEQFSPAGWQEELRAFQPGIVGISVQTLNYPSGRLIAQLTKQLDQDIQVVMGGVHATMQPEECLEHCDIVVRGEGEETFSQICQGQEWEDIKGISFRSQGGITHNGPRERMANLDDLPLRAYHLLKVEKYKVFPKWNIVGSRGCPYGCTYCCSPPMWGRITRFRSARKIVDEIEYLHSQFSIQHLDFVDDTINISQQRAFDICDEIIGRGLHKKMSFACSMRADKQLVSLEVFQKLKETNFVKVCLGIESASEKVLKLMRKNLTVEEVRQFTKLARRAGIPSVEGYFMVGNWGETMGDVLKTWRFVLSNNVEPSFSICTPFPGTTFYHQLRNGGYLAEDPDWSNFNQSTPITRTDKMSRLGILLVHFLSVLIEHALFLVRVRKLRYTPPRLMQGAFMRVVLTGRAIWALRRAS